MNLNASNTGAHSMNDDLTSDEYAQQLKASNGAKKLITHQPESRDQLQTPFAFEWQTPDNGSYGSLVDSVGYCFGQIGLIPCCLCFSNPYKKVDQGYVGLVTKFGQLYKAVDPGLVKVNPLSEKIILANVMLKTMQIPTMSCYTMDNVSVSLSSVLYYQVTEPHNAIFTVDDIEETLRERTQTTLRQVIGSRNLQDVIERREEIASSIEEVISDTASSWGVKIESLLIKDLNLPQTVSNSLSMAAEAKRIGESKIIQARAEVESAKLMRKAADILASKAAMQIRYLDAMQNMAKSANSKVIFMPGQSAIENSAAAAGGSSSTTQPYSEYNDISKIAALEESFAK
ncbi:hypothetical protein CANARDRAFT_174375 [[Candida] arabinofermentans NRRL YB-2248]|uniref:Band 7 domain-containing protein n=1 Tax=[Candida] arabinofermentans NRRL YB-2248 TaxID=983967 RepID=A0A1E4T6C6_9ASCO|nr:hypothetical protein CANARDRAFT_174375 [[Candida] arabinofermentans NRRL YB-2248]